MTEILFRSIDRRTFIRTSLAVTGTLIALGGASCYNPEIKEKQVVRLVLLADVHIPADIENNYRGFYPYRNLEKIIPDIVSASPDGVVIAGDLARLTGELGDYDNLKKLLNPLTEKAPVFMALGNHDNRENFFKTFQASASEKQAVPGKHVLVVQKPPVRLILLDSLLFTDKVPGLLGKQQRQWLQNHLKESDNTLTILCFHHTLEDADDALLDLPRLFDMIKSIPKVKAIVYGHSHEYAFSQYEGIHLINLPAVGYNFNDKDPVGWVDARLDSRGGDFTLHVAGGNKDNDGRVTKLTWR